MENRGGGYFGGGTLLTFAKPLSFPLISGQAEEEEEDTQEELSALIEEAHMPLHSLLAKYGATNPSKDAEGKYGFYEC